MVDFTDMIKKGGHYFKPLRDVELFKQVGLDDDEYPSSIRWPNDADICPDVLYEIGTEVKSSTKLASKKPRRRVAASSRNHKSASPIVAKSK